MHFLTIHFIPFMLPFNARISAIALPYSVPYFCEDGDI